MSHQHVATPTNEHRHEDSDETASWGATLTAWRSTIRGLANMTLLLALVVIAIRTLNDRSTGNPIEAYLGGLFFIALATGLTFAVNLLTRSK